MLDLSALRNEFSVFPEYSELLYCKGFLITDDTTFNQNDFSLSWEKETFGNYTVWHDKKLPLYIDGNILLLGHAYNPYDMDYCEESILRKMSNLSDEKFWEYEADLTGNHTMAMLCEDGGIAHWADCAGMIVSYYGKINTRYYITSHVNIVTTHLKLKEDPYITKLKNSRYFKLFGNVLPGDLSPVKEMKRSVPNYLYCSDGSIRRFYPTSPITECKTEEDYQSVLRESAEVLRKTLTLCAKKWPDRRTAISVTGGKDSGVTLASANGLYENFQYFSYISKPEESVDAEAAHTICKELNLEHKIYNISDDTENFPDYQLMRELISYNGGNVGYLKSNEIRKRSSFLHENFPFDVEIKSWVDEISRAYWNKKYNKTSFPEKPTGKYLATLYKVFLENRLLFKQTSDVFEDYIQKYMSDTDITLMGSWLTLWSWEFGHSAGEGQHMTDEQVLAFDVTVPFNNRHLITTMLRPKLQDRIDDRLQRDIIKMNNPKQAAIGIDVVNAAHTEKRAVMERIYLTINTHIPF